MPTPIHVVVPVKGRLDLTRRMVRSLRHQGHERLTIYDNGSPRRDRRVLERLADEVVEAKGWSIHAMWNAGLDRSPDAHVAILNNDIILGPGALAKLGDVLDRYPKLAVVSPRHDGFRPQNRIRQVDRIATAGGIAGFAFMVAADWPYRFPTNLRWWYGDNDMVLTALEDGRQCAVVESTTVDHVNGGSQTGQWLDNPERVREILEDRANFIEKWGTLR